MTRLIPSSLSPWSPFERIAPWRDLLEAALASPASGLRAGWVPAIEVRDESEAVTVEVEAPGIKKEDFEISLEDDTLTVSGKRERSSQRGESFRGERVFGTFQRSITLPAPVRADAVEATYTDGVLTIRLPKADEAKPRRIEIKN